MSEYVAKVVWRRADGERYTDGKYSRTHRWLFDGGTEVRASASPSVVPLPYADADAVDPEEALVAAVSSCHMLWFLSLAAKRGFVVDSYTDDAVGLMEKGPDGRESITRVTLRPRIAFSGNAPTADELDKLHDRAHDACYIAHSIKAEVTVEHVE